MADLSGRAKSEQYVRNPIRNHSIGAIAPVVGAVLTHETVTATLGDDVAILKGLTEAPLY